MLVLFIVVIVFLETLLALFFFPSWLWLQVNRESIDRGTIRLRAALVLAATFAAMVAALRIVFVRLFAPWISSVGTTG